MRCLLSALFVFLLTIASYARADDLDELVRSEVRRLNTVYGTSATATIQASGASDSTADGRITIGQAEIQTIAQTAGARNIAWIERFVLGHEMVHQFQFRLYGPNALTSGIDQRRVFECQADMLAAADLIAGQPIDRTRVSDFVSGLEDVLKVAFTVGTENYAWQDHPDHEQRRLAVRLGLSLGLLKAMQHAPDADNDLAAEIKRKIDVRPGESDADWSLRLSKRVVHFEREAVSALSLGDADIAWDKRAEHPFVTYSLPYTNRADRPLHLELEIVTAMIPRFNRSNTAKWDRFDVRNYSLDLAPGETRVLSGELRWYGDSEWMPRLLYPPNTQTLFSASLARRIEGTSGPSSVAPAFLQPTDPGVSSSDFSRLLKRIVNQSANCFRQLQATTIAERLDLGDDDYADIFPANLQLPGIVKVEVWRDKDGSCRVTGTVHTGRSKEGAITAFADFKATLATALGAVAQERVSSSDQLPRASVSIANGWEARLNISLRSRTGVYTVRFGIDKSD